MTYIKYAVKDNAYGNLLAGISAGTATINLKSGDGTRFPTGNFIATLVQYTVTGDATTPIVAQELILVTNRSTDTLTVTRGYGGTTPTSFSAGDNIYLNVVALITQDIQDEVTRLETAKLNITAFNNSLRDNLTAWRLIYINASGDETPLALGTAGQFLKSNGASVAPTWEAPTVDINGLSADSGTLAVDDYLVEYDASAGVNKKRLAKASATNEGLVEMLTDAEFSAGSDESRYANAKQVKNRNGYTLLAGGPTIYSNTSLVSHNNGTPTKKRTVRFNNSGTINFVVAGNTSSGSTSSGGVIQVKRGATILGSVNFGTSGGSVSVPITLTGTSISNDDIDVYLTNNDGNTTNLTSTTVNAYIIPISLAPITVL